MDARGLFNQLFQTGKGLAKQGQSWGEKAVGVPKSGPERETMLAGMGKGALAAGALAMLFGTRTGRRATRSAVQIGSLAALGGLAYTAYQSWQSKNASAPPPGRPMSDLSDEEAQKRSLGLLKAMIAAAKADGHIDAFERQRIDQAIGKMGLGSEAAALFQEELRKPLNPAEIASAAESPEAAAEIYLMSRMVVDLDHPQERSYLEQLATALDLDDDLVQHLDQQAEQIRRD